MQVGYNFQRSCGTLFGVEADWSWANLDATILDNRTLPAEPQHTPQVLSLQEAKPTKLLGFYDGGGESLLTKVCVTH